MVIPNGWGAVDDDAARLGKCAPSASAHTSPAATCLLSQQRIQMIIEGLHRGAAATNKRQDHSDTVLFDSPTKLAYASQVGHREGCMERRWKFIEFLGWMIALKKSILCRLAQHKFRGTFTVKRPTRLMAPTQALKS